MNKSLLILVVVVVLGLTVGGYIYWKEANKTPEEKAAEAFRESLKAAAAGGMPDIETRSNPLAEMPEINPIDKVNPFKDVSLNPFE